MFQGVQAEDFSSLWEWWGQTKLWSEPMSCLRCRGPCSRSDTILQPQPSALLNTVLEADCENPPLDVFQRLYISLQRPVNSERLEQQRHWKPHPLGRTYLTASPLVFTVSGVS